MNLISCDGCGVVLDKDKLNFPEGIHDDEGVVDDTKASWNGRAWVASIQCPVCDQVILSEE